MTRKVPTLARVSIRCEEMIIGIGDFDLIMRLDGHHIKLATGSPSSFA